MSKPQSKAQSFRISEEILELLRTWSFVTGKGQREIIEEALTEYMNRDPETKEKVEKVMKAME
jgi:predicted DNA-binding protein